VRGLGFTVVIGGLVQNRPERSQQQAGRAHLHVRPQSPDEGLVANSTIVPDQAALPELHPHQPTRIDALHGLTDIKAEANLASGRRLDLLAKRPRRNQLVGIGLKLDEADDRAVGQSQH
jgi:hypothetical protein